MALFQHARKLHRQHEMLQLQDYRVCVAAPSYGASSGQQEMLERQPYRGMDYILDSIKIMSVEDFTLGGLFLSAFLSSTLLPGSSEVVLAVVANQHDYDPWILLSVATAGNTLGGMTSWGLGRLISWKYPLSKLSKPNQQRAIERIQRWGSPALLFSWVPVVGDPLCVAAGWLKVNGWIALLFIGVGKALRYAAIIAMV